MQTLELLRLFRKLGRPCCRVAVLFVVCCGALFLSQTGCKKESSEDAIRTDANGYLCQKCGVKLYTERAVFIGPKCPKCGEESLREVIGYECPKDHWVTIRARRGDSQPLSCDKCQGPVADGMRAPREKDLKAWGATKA